MNRYHNVKPIEKETAELVFLSNNVEEICDSMIAVAFHERNLEWAQDVFLNFLSHKDVSISGLAATCLGHLARIHRHLEKAKVIDALKNALKRTEIKGQVEDAIEDIEFYIH